jgi:hypothetical protein
MNTSKIDVLAMAAEEASAKMNCNRFEEESRRVPAIDGTVPPSVPVKDDVNCSVEENNPIQYRTNSAFEPVQSPKLSLVSTTTAIGLRPPPLPVLPNMKQKLTFVDKLHAVLADEECNSVISWLPSGKSFVVLDKEQFAKTVLPKYFKEAKFDR